jgi:hypothetical protein
MFSNSRLHIATLLLVCFAPALHAQDNDRHFIVKNKTDSNITKLEVSQNKRDWGNFDIGSGIGPGDRVKLIWTVDTDAQKCHQWIRAKFSDGTWSDPIKEDFCHDLDEPIEFTE